MKSSCYFPEWSGPATLTSGSPVVQHSDKTFVGASGVGVGSWVTPRGGDCVSAWLPRRMSPCRKTRWHWAVEADAGTGRVWNETI